MAATPLSWSSCSPDTCAPLNTCACPPPSRTPSTSAAAARRCRVIVHKPYLNAHACTLYPLTLTHAAALAHALHQRGRCTPLWSRTCTSPSSNLYRKPCSHAKGDY